MLKQKFEFRYDVSTRKMVSVPLGELETWDKMEVIPMKDPTPEPEFLGNGDLETKIEKTRSTADKYLGTMDQMGEYEQPLGTFLVEPVPNPSAAIVALIANFTFFGGLYYFLRAVGAL